MQVIHGMGFNDMERSEYIQDIHRNIFESMEILANQIQLMGIRLGDPSREEDITTFQTESNPAYIRLNAVRSLWQDSAFQECYSRRAEYDRVNRLNTSTEYFLTEIDRISENNYLPINDDIIRVRRETTGVLESEFRMGDVDFKITDVGGGEQERQNWISLLQDQITCVIFLVAMDEYDSTYYAEDGSVRNRLKDSIDVFKEIQANRWMPHTNFILFLNKFDIFSKKIKYSNIEDHFPEFQGFPKNVEDGKKFIHQKFHNLRANGRFIFAQFTNATDAENMRFVFDCVKDTILQMNLRQIHEH